MFLCFLPITFSRRPLKTILKYNFMLRFLCRYTNVYRYDIIR